MAINNQALNNIYEKMENHLSAYQSLVELLSLPAKSAELDTEKFYFLLNALVETHDRHLEELCQLIGK